VANPQRVHPPYRWRWWVNRFAKFLGRGFIIKTVGTLVAFLAPVSALLIGFVKWVDSAGAHAAGVFEPTVAWIYDRRVGLGLILLATQTGCIVLLGLFKLRWLRPIDRRRIEKVLQQEVRRFFGEGDHAEHHYRCTLFKKRWFPFLGCWLGSVARSGESFRRMQTIFSVDANAVKHNTGIAGECFRRGRPIIKSLDFAVSDEDTTDGEESRRRYRRETYLAAEEYDRMSITASVFLAVPIRVGDAMWGVLVLDSTDPASAPAQGSQSSERLLSLNTTAVYLGAMLE
jgi:hypothetical protein